MKKEKILLVDFTVRLPDIDRPEALPHGFSDYGRFGILKSGNFWFAGIRSSHPDVQVGFYWALNQARDVLYISSRGVMMDMERLTRELIVYIIEQLKLDRQFGGFRVIRE